MEKKTISHLQAKTWYRLIKVIFFVALFIVLGLFNLLVFSSGVRQIDQGKTKIQCNQQYYVNKVPQGYKQFTLNDFDLNIPLDNGFNYKDFYSNPNNEFVVKYILSKCTGVMDFDQINLSFDQILSDVEKDNPSITDDSAALAVYNNAIKTDENNGLTEQDSANNVNSNLETYDSHQFDIIPVYTYTSFLELFLIGNFIILLIFELIRRMFYYVVLGSIKPEK